MKLISILLLMTLAAAAQTVNYPFVVKPLAGTSEIGNGLQATQALLKSPGDIVADAAGGFAILDYGNRQIRRVGSDGVITIVASLSWDCYDMKAGRDGSYYLTASALVIKVAPDGKASVIAGTGVPGSSLDGGQATTAALSGRVTGIALDSNNNVYFVEGTRVRKVTPAGIISTVAGITTPGYGGDNGPAISAQLNYPHGLAFDAAGNLYIADQSNYRIRKINTSGVITTIAGNGNYGLPVNGAATASPLGFPQGIAVDAAGNVFFTDIGTNLLLKIDGATGAVSTLAGGGALSYADAAASSVYLHGPSGIAIESNGSVLFTEYSSNRVRRLSAGNVRTVAGRVHIGGDNGPATDATLNSPIDVAYDAQGNLYIADAEGNQLRQVSASGIIKTVAGTGLPGSPAPGASAATSLLPRITAVAVDSIGNIFVAAPTVVYRITPSGAIDVYAGTAASGNGGAGDGGPATQATFLYISGLAVDSAGNLYIADHANHRVRKVSAASGMIAAFAGTGVSGFVGENGPALSAQFRSTYAMPLAIDAKNNVYIGDDGNFRVRMVSPDGVITTVAGNGQSGDPEDGAQARNTPLKYPAGLAVDRAGVLYVAIDIALQPFGRHSIYRVEGGVIRPISGLGDAAPADGIAATANYGFDAHGMRIDLNGDLIASDYSGGVVRKLMRNSPRDLTVFDGNNQSGAVGSALPKALQVRVNGRAGLVVAGEPVTFKVTSGDASLSGANAAADDTGLASVTLTMGSTAGPVTVTATAAGLSAVTFSATATAGLAIAPESLSFAYTIGTDAPEAQQISVSGPGLAANASVDGDVAWLQAVVVDGGVKVSLANLEQLVSGVYNGKVSISADGFDSRVVLVVLSVNDASLSKRRPSRDQRGAVRF